MTDSGNPDATYSADEMKAFGDHVNELGKVAIDSGLTFSYHPHLSSLGETREGLDRIMAATDPRYLKLQPDVAHMTLGGMNPADAIRTYRDRLAFFHFKDAVHEVAVQAKEDRSKIRKAKVRFCEVGQGAVDYPAVLAAMDDAHFTGWIVVELDAYKAPPGGPAEAARTNQLAMRKMGFNI
jgi:inosose dehydratase